MPARSGLRSQRSLFQFEPTIRLAPTLSRTSSSRNVGAQNSPTRDQKTDKPTVSGGSKPLAAVNNHLSWFSPSVSTDHPPIMTEHMVPLSDFALALVAASPRRIDRDYVCGNGPRRNGDDQRGFSGWSKAKATLDQRILEARQQADPKG